MIIASGSWLLFNRDMSTWISSDHARGTRKTPSETLKSNVNTKIHEHTKRALNPNIGVEILRADAKFILL